MRVKRGVKARRRRNRLLDISKGFRGRSGNTIRQASGRAKKAMRYMYRDRKVNKRNFRSLWITRINAAARLSDLSYSQFINGLHRAGVDLDRKILADLGAEEPVAFAKLAEIAKENLAVH